MRHGMGLALTILALSCACDDTPTGRSTDVARRALEFAYVIHPGRTTPGRVLLRCGVLVGPDSCWTIESARARLDGYMVVVEGTAVRAFPHVDCGRAARYDTLSLETPPLLETARYDLVAGDLVDDLWIHPDYEIAQRWLVARGSICPPHITTLSCYHFVPSHPAREIAGGWLVRDWPPPTRCISAALYAEILGWGDCTPGSGEDNLLAVRRVVHLLKVRPQSDRPASTWQES